jgi:hypothetical protein
MRDKREMLGKVFSFSSLAFLGTFFLVTTLRFLSSSFIVETIMMVGLMIIGLIIIFVYPNFQKVITTVPYRWGAVTVLAISLVFVGISMFRLPLIIDELMPSVTDYVAVIGSGLFAIANIITVILTFRSEHPHN